MNAPSVDVKDMLEEDSSLGLVCGRGGNLYVGREPTLPQNCVTILDLHGKPPQLTLTGKGEFYDYPIVQIRVRDGDYRTGWALINNIMLSLHGRASETWNGTLYTAIYCSSGPALLTWDDNELVIFISNFNLQRR